MFKVSFKEGSKKVRVFNDKATVVTLIGYVKLPKWWHECVPEDIIDWAVYHPSVDFDILYDKGYLARIEVSAKAVCADDDVWDAVLGERIAESRAKIRLYKFMHTLCHKLYDYYYNLALGDRFGVQVTEVGNYLHRKHTFGGIFATMGKYQGLLIKESHHLGELL